MATIQEQLRAFFAEGIEGIAAVYLFGSVARNDARAESDVDVAVLYQRDPPHTLGGLSLDVEANLERTLGRRAQLVVLNRAPVDLVHRVLRDGELILENDRSARIRFEVRARNEYFDLLPFLLRYRRVAERAA